MQEPKRWQDAFTSEERAYLLEISDWRAWRSLGLNWAAVLLAFALVAFSPGAVTVAVAVFVIGGRQLGFAVLMHEASHGTLLRDRKWNDRVGNWLCAYPIWSDLHPYRLYHLRHHARTWTADDPDLALVTPFPISVASLWRKIGRDLSGRTGLKRARAVLARDLGRSQGRTGRGADGGWHNLRGVVVTNAVMLGLLALSGFPELYLLWVAAWLTSYSLAMRIRSIAEHAMVPDASDPLQNTRTTLASWWERLFLAPNRVNFHLEHHLLMTVPHYKLPLMHRLLRERSVLDSACVAHGYREVLALAASRPAA